eukprot:787374-Rhodomonas_salina.1
MRGTDNGCALARGTDNGCALATRRGWRDHADDCCLRGITIWRWGGGRREEGGAMEREQRAGSRDGAGSRERIGRRGVWAQIGWGWDMDWGIRGSRDEG